MYTRREFSTMMLGGLPLSMASAALAKINSKFRGVQIGAITYSFRSMPPAEIIPAMVRLGLSEAELMSNHQSSLEGPEEEPGAERAVGTR